MDQKAYDTLWVQLRWDLARLKALEAEAERGNPGATQEFYELQGAMQVKLALVEGMIRRRRGGGP